MGENEAAIRSTFKILPKSQKKKESNLKGKKYSIELR